MAGPENLQDIHPLAEYCIVVVAAFFASFLGITLLRRFWHFKRGVDEGDGVRKHQKEPVLRVGGLPLYAAFVVTFMFALMGEGEGGDSIVSYSFLILGSAIFLLGILDDLFHLPAQVKFVIQIAIAVGAYSCGMRIDAISNPLEPGSIELGGYGLVLTVLWFVALPNLINLIDGMDGLAGGVCLFLLITLAAIGMMTGNAALAIMGVGVAGGIAAFLVFNLPPARIYMGDGGAYLLGFIIAGTSLLTSHKASIFGPLLVVIIALGFPILDTTLAVLRRGLSGLPVMAPDARHLHHRLLTLGFSKRMIIMVLYGVFAGLCLLGLSVFATKGNSLPIAGMVVVVAVLSVLRFLGLPHNLAEARIVLAELLASRKNVRYAYSMAQVLEHDLDRIEDEDEYWNEIILCLKKLDISPAERRAGEILECGEGKCLVEISVGDEFVWNLCCPIPEGHHTQWGRQWNRVIRCFLQALMNGKAKWGDFGGRLSIESRSSAEGFADENRIEIKGELQLLDQSPTSVNKLSKL